MAKTDTPTTTYYPWHARRNTETGELALRTIFPEDQGPQLANMAWLIIHASAGSRHAPTDQVTGTEWADTYVAPAPEVG